MPNEQITLSYVLDLIAQSKADIKGSVEYKGGTIGDDLTEYSTSINNIQFRSIYVEENTVEVPMYGSYVTIDALQYINGNKSYPTNISYTVSGSSSEVEWVDNPTERGPQQFNVTPVNYGTTTLVIEDEMGNCNYPITLLVPVITIHGDYDNTMSGFDSFQWDENIPGEGADTLTGWNAAWDTSVQQNPNFTATFSFNDGNGHNVDTANLSFEITGDVIDAGLVTVTYVTASNTATFTFTPHYNNDDSQYEYYNGVINIAISDGTSTGDIAPIYLTGGEDIPVYTYYIYAGNITNATVTYDDGVGIAEGQTETITVTPDSGYVLNTLVVEGDTTGHFINPTDLGNGEYSFVMPAEDVNIHVNCRQTGPQSLSEVRQLENNTEFTFDGTVTVINKSSNNRELYVQDADGSAGIKMFKSYIGSSFSTGDVIYNGWTATKSVYNGVTQLGRISNLNYSGDTTTLIANELSIPSFTESDTYNYYVFRNITINGNAIEDGVGNTMAIYNQFSTTIPSDAQHYDAYGVVAWYNNATSFYPMSFELVGGDDGSSDDTDEPHFSSPTDGDTLTGTLDSESGDFKYPIEVVGSDGNNISYDITSANIYPEAGGSPWNISYDEEDDGNGGTYISRVYMVCYIAGLGSETLTFTDPNTGTTCSTTFTYDISEGGSEPIFTYDGSDENSPIQVNVDLANYPGGEIDSVPAPEVNINFVAPSSDYNWDASINWGNDDGLNSNNNNDCMLRQYGSMFGLWTLGDVAYGYTGPQSAGTYLRSYSVTFNYDSSLSMKYDETTGERINDPVAQALDGTVITFWVEYNVTGTIPMPE